MTELISATDAAVVQRRRFLRGGALLAAAAGGAVAASASSVLPASAEPVPTPVATSIPVPAERLLDTRSSAGLRAIVASSNGALDSKNRLKGGAWIDVAIATTVEDTDFELVAVFVNLKSLDSTKGGSLVVAEPGDKPTGTTLTYSKGRTTTNSAFVGVGVVEDSYVVRVFATSTGHVTLDLTGAEIVVGDSSAPAARTAGRTNVQRVLKAVHAVRR